MVGNIKRIQKPMMKLVINMMKVMLIEDDVTMRSLLKTLLEIEGYQVVNYQYEDDLTAPIKREFPDSIVLDVHFNRVNGLDIVRRIREDETITHTRVIMTSGKDMAEECKAAGADDFLLKPFMPDVLLEKILPTNSS